MAQSLLLPLQRAVTVGSMALPFSGSAAMRLVPASPVAVCASRTPHAQFRLNAAPGGVLGVEPDLDEEQRDIWMTAGEDMEEEFFPYGKADGAHTWHKGDDEGGFIEPILKQIEESGGPATHPGQNVISWLFLPGIFSGMAFGIQSEYLYLACVLFIFAFIGIEMAKPDKPSNFEPEISRLDRVYDKGYKPSARQGQGN